MPAASCLLLRKLYVSPVLRDIYPYAHRPLPHCFPPAILAVVPLQPLTYTFGRAVRETMRALGGVQQA